MENRKQGWGNLPPSAAEYRTNAVVSQPSTQTPQEPLSGSLKTPNDGQKTGLKYWLGGLVNNPTTGALSHDKVWTNICAAAMTWKFCQSDPTEWQWWAYGGMVGGYGLARRAIAAMQQVAEKQKEKD